ncbi:MAG: glycosyltransferase, partial [Prevotella sp.]|nr:glycosyltransferase [Prevotella sp.]
MNDLKISVIMSIYKSDVPEYVRIALDSLLNQTRLPDEIVIVADGPVPAKLEQE